MIFAYVDESGNTGTRKDVDQPVHLLGCLLVRDQSIRPLEDAIAAVSAAHIPKLAAAPGFELHASEIFGGKGPFRDVDPAARVALVMDLVDAVAEHADAFGFTGVNKLKTFANDHPHCIAFALLVERLEPYLTKKNQLGLIVADENQEIGQRLIDDMQFYKEYATSFGYRSVKVNRIVDSIHFVQSKNNRIIQACDVITYFLAKGKKVHARLMAGFLERAPNFPPWTQWVAEEATVAEKATLDIQAKIGKIERFAAKIFNE